jgi:hypothetical protein
VRKSGLAVFFEVPSRVDEWDLTLEDTEHLSHWWIYLSLGLKCRLLGIFRTEFGAEEFSV